MVERRRWCGSRDRVLVTHGSDAKGHSWTDWCHSGKERPRDCDPVALCRFFVLQYDDYLIGLAGRAAHVQSQGGVNKKEELERRCWQQGGVTNEEASARRSWQGGVGEETSARTRRG